MILGRKKGRSGFITEAIEVQGITYPAGTRVSAILQAMTDNQTVSLEENTLTIEGGNSVDFDTVELKDAFGTHLQEVIVS